MKENMNHIRKQWELLQESFRFNMQVIVNKMASPIQGVQVIVANEETKHSQADCPVVQEILFRYNGQWIGLSDVEEKVSGSDFHECEMVYEFLMDQNELMSEGEYEWWKTEFPRAA